MHRIKNFCLALAILQLITARELCCGQSTFVFANWYEGELDAAVFDAQGNRLFGTNYLAILYGGPTIDSLAPATVAVNSAEVMPPEPFTVPLSPFGYFYRASHVVIGSVEFGGYAWLQVRAWDARLGSSYEDVAALGLGGYGESNFFRTYGGNPLSQFHVPQPLRGLQSFSLLPEVPEPNTVLIFLLGLPLLLSRYRRRLR